MNFTSQICTTEEQSERLLALGLKRETADMGLAGDIPIAIEDWKTQDTTLIDSPAWSLHRLIEMIPSEIPMEDYYLILGVSFNCVYYADNEYAEVFQSFDGNTYSCIINCIQWLIAEGYFNKKYLED